MASPTTVLHWANTPVGALWGQLNAANQLTALHWGTPPKGSAVHPQQASHPVYQALTNYFSKSGQNSVKDIKNSIAFSTGTPFQQRVWQALLTIPFGQTLTYGQLAKQLNSSPRAVGGAVGANPIGILVPCHRVMGQGGKLTGFSAPGGIQTKQKLLQHEGIKC